jgi:hypothetical protein
LTLVIIPFVLFCFIFWHSKNAVSFFLTPHQSPHVKFRVGTISSSSSQRRLVIPLEYHFQTTKRYDDSLYQIIHPCRKIVHVLSRSTKLQLVEVDHQVDHQVDYKLNPPTESICCNICISKSSIRRFNHFQKLYNLSHDPAIKLQPTWSRSRSLYAY